MQKQLPVLDFAGKRDFIESMGITVWLNGEDVEVTGFIPAEDDVTLTALYQGHWLKG